MSKLWVLVFVAACGAKAATPTTDPTNSAPPDQSPPTATEGAICGTRGVPECPDGEFCSYQPGADCGIADKPGHCMKKPEMCPQIYKPVCGCDGKKYPNDCAAAAAETGVRGDVPANGQCLIDI